MLTFIKRYRTLLFFFFAYGFGFYIIIQRALADLAQNGQHYRQADWLINNSAGLIRRGFGGDMLIFISDITSISPVFLVVAVQVFLISALFLTFSRIGWAARGNDSILFLLISPVFLLFYAYDAGGSLRKEILGFSAFLPLLWGSGLTSLKFSVRPKKWPVLLSSAIFAVACFWHELNVFFAPVLAVSVYFYFAGGGGGNWRLAFSSVYLIVAFSAGLFAMLFSSVPDITPICSALSDANELDHLCGGAIAWLDKDTTYALSRVWKMIISGNVFLPITLLIALSYFIFLLGEFVSWKVIVTIYIGCLVLFSPLFIVAIDWGRWAVLATFCFTVLILFYLRINDKITALSFSTPVWLSCALFSSIWGVNHVGGSPVFTKGIYANIARIGAGLIGI